MRGDGTHRSPLEVMTGIQPRRSLIIGIDHAPESTKKVTIERVKAEQAMNVELLQSTLLQMHKKVALDK